MHGLDIGGLVGVIFSVIYSLALGGTLIYLLVRFANKKDNENMRSTYARNTAAREPRMVNIDNSFFLMKNGRLIEYRGESSTIFVPRGVQIIGGNDTPVCKNKISTIYLPDSVYVISDCALPYVESVYYEGPQENLHFDKQYNFYADGWTPDWAQGHLPPIRINEVRFHFNDRSWGVIINNHFKEHPEELLPDKSR